MGLLGFYYFFQIILHVTLAGFRRSESALSSLEATILSLDHSTCDVKFCLLVVYIGTVWSISTTFCDNSMLVYLELGRGC